MSDKYNYNNIGDQMKDALTDALQNGNFQTLNRLVSQTVNATLDEVGIHIQPEGSGPWSSHAQSGGQASGGTDQTDIPLWQQALGPDIKGRKTGWTADSRQQTRYGSTGPQTGSSGQAQRQAGNSGQAQRQAKSSGQAGSSGQAQRQAGTQNRTAWQQQNGQAKQQNTAWQQSDAWQQQEAERQARFQRQQEAERLRREAQLKQQQEAERLRREAQLKQQQEAERLRQQRQQEEASRRRQDAQMRRQAEQTKRQQRQMQEASLRQQRRQREIQLKQQRQMQKQQQAGYMTAASFIPMRQVGRVSGVLWQIFGGIGAGFTALLLMGSTVTPDIPLAMCLFLVLFLAVFLGLFGFGIRQQRLLRHAKRYASLCDSRMFVQISELALGTGKPEAFVAKELQRILNAGIFPEGHLDEQKTCFMFNNVVFRQYLAAENERRRREEEARLSGGGNIAGAVGADQADGSAEGAAAVSSELNAIMAEGMEYVRRLRELNDQIEGEVISARLFRLEHLLKDIFDNIREHPEQIPRIHKLMEYYLPTTLKLVDAYADFDQISAPGDEIIKAKSEIENTLDTINQAFTELLNNLFQDAVFDATTDAQVLKTMLAREGLTRDMDFAAQKTDTEKADTENADGGKADEQ